MTNLPEMQNTSHSHNTDLRQFYDQEAVREIDDATINLMWYRFYTMMNMIRGKNLTVLDIGAGNGDVAFKLIGRGFSCIVMDISNVRLKKYADKARTLGIKQVLGNVEDRIPLENASVDVVLCGEVIEHVPDNDKALDEIYRVLKPEGQFIMSVPFRETLKIAKCPECGKVFELNGHLHTYDSAVVRALFRRHHFTLVKSHIGHTKFSRILWQQWSSPLSLGICHRVDNITEFAFRASDTWIMVKGIKQL